MVYCTNCNHQLSSTDKFCSQCGTPLGGQVRREVGNGHWEYKDLTINMGNIVVQSRYGFPIGGIAHELVPVVEGGVNRFLNQIAQEGWEPRESTDALSLCLKGRIDCTNKVNGFTGRHTITVHTIRLSCKRWIAS